jgi:hypothetical protein
MITNIIIIFFNIFFWTAGINSFFGKRKGLDYNDVVILKRLFVYHQIISIVFSFYILKFGGDANLYWFINNQYDLNSPWLS